MTLDTKTAIEIDKERDKADVLMNELVRDPEVLKLIMQKITDLGLQKGLKGEAHEGK